MNKLRWMHKSHKGQSFVELGFFMVILLLLLVGVIEFGTLIFQYIGMKDAAQEGSVYASMYPAACNQAIERVRAGLYNVDPTQVQVQVYINGVQCSDATVTDACANKEAKVVVRQPNYPIMVPFLGTLLGRQTISVSAETTSTIIRPPCH